MNLEGKIAFHGELQLLGWSETNTRGRTVTFQVDGDDVDHPFKTFTTRKGKVAGHRFAVVMVEIDDNEQPVEQKKAGMKLSQMAAALGKSPQFLEWADEECWDFSVEDEASARRFVLSQCNIQSRSELDTNSEAEQLFRSRILEPFQQWEQVPHEVDF